MREANTEFIRATTTSKDGKLFDNESDDNSDQDQQLVPEKDTSSSGIFGAGARLNNLVIEQVDDSERIDEGTDE